MSINIPEDIIIEILRSLPVKSLLRFINACTQWKSLILNPKFSLISTTIKGRERALFCCRYECSKQIGIFETITVTKNSFCSLDKNLSVESVFPPHHFELAMIRFLGSCNGLLLIADSRLSKDSNSNFKCLWLWNPFTRFCREVLCDKKFLHIDVHSINASGLCYDDSTHDYKAVMQLNSSVNKNYVIVAGLRRKTWRMITTFTYELAQLGVLVNEKLHWLVKDKRSLIVYFDAKYNHLVEFATPEATMFNAGECQMGVLDGCLSLFSHGNSREYLNVFVMKEYGVKESWEVMFSIPYKTSSPPWRNCNTPWPGCLPQPIFSMENMKNIVIDCPPHSRGVKVYNFENNSFKNIHVEKIFGWFSFHRIAYIETLASL